MYLRGNWSSVCPALLCNPRRSQVAPGILYLHLLDNGKAEEFNHPPPTLLAQASSQKNSAAAFDMLPDIEEYYR